jgi:hypothetical protein
MRVSFSITPLVSRLLSTIAIAFRPGQPFIERIQDLSRLAVVGQILEMIEE